MDEETGKLIDLVEARRALYDARDMDHANRKRIENLWIEVSIEMNWEVSECKRKWASLRNAYTRCLREERTKSSGLFGKKKKWYWADSMSFLNEHINPQYSNISNFDSTDLDSPPSLNENIETMESDTSIARNSHLPTKRSRTLVSEPAAAPVFEFVQSKARESVPENGNSLFFMSLLADYEKLTTRRQRAFRMHMLTKMNELQEEEENEALNAASEEEKFYNNYERHNSHSNKSFERF